METTSIIDFTNSSFGINSGKTTVVAVGCSRAQNPCVIFLDKYNKTLYFWLHLFFPKRFFCCHHGFHLWRYALRQ
jgi:hypothetical protein